MSRETVELDFFGMEKENSSKSQFQKFLHCQRSFRGIQSGISKINPELLKSLLTSGSASKNLDDVSKKSFSVPSSPMGDPSLFSALPVYVPTLSPLPDNLRETTPMTIFYNGTVSVFDVARDKAENILKIAFEGIPKAVQSNSNLPLASVSGDQSQLLDPFNGDLPIARKKSLQRFLAKRKERLSSVSPYACPN